MPEKLNDRDALTLEFSNIKPRLIPSIVEGFNRLKPKLQKISLAGLVLSSTFVISPSLPIIGSKIHAQEMSVQFSLPHMGYISTYFSAFHPGIDIATDYGAPIHPVASGSVESIIFDNFDYGTHVIVNHKDGYKSLYGHMSKVFVTIGQKVDTNTVLGQVGLTGHTSGPHTHLEITKDSKYIDPLSLLPNVLTSIPTFNTIKSVGGALPDPKPTELRKTLKPDFTL